MEFNYQICQQNKSFTLWSSFLKVVYFYQKRKYRLFSKFKKKITSGLARVSVIVRELVSLFISKECLKGEV